MLRPRLFVVDTNVWIDYLLGNEPFCTSIVRFSEEAVSRDASLLYAPTTLKDVYYIGPRELRCRSSLEDKHAPSALNRIAWACVESINSIATAAPQSKPEYNLAWMLRHKHGDLEDNLVMTAAETCDANYVVTYDQQLITHFSPVCITPEQALELLSFEG